VRLDEVVSAEDAPVTLVVRINGREMPDGLGPQAAVLPGLLADAGARHRVAELLGLDRLTGAFRSAFALVVFSRPVAAALGFLPGGRRGGQGVDDSPAGQSGAVARAARAVAETSEAVPVVVLIDDADLLDRDLAVTLLENLAGQ
jgi:hypothetical protein